MEKTNRREENKYLKGSEVCLCVCTGTRRGAIATLRRVVGIGFFEKRPLELGPEGGEGVSPGDLEGVSTAGAKTLSPDWAWCAANRWSGRHGREGKDGLQE